MRAIDQKLAKSCDKVKAVMQVKQSIHVKGCGDLSLLFPTFPSLGDFSKESHDADVLGGE